MSSAAWRKPNASINSSGTAFDGGWQRWWSEQSKLDQTDWKSLLDAADSAISRLRAKHLVRVSS
jgi:hypothetical protein